MITSPHLTGSHIESALHVLEEAKAVKEVLALYKNILPAFHLKIKAELVQISRVEVLGGKTTFVFSSGDTYSLISTRLFTELPEEFVVTREMLARAIGDLKEKVVLICFTGHEHTVHNWPYLTNEAVSLLVEKGVELIGLNIPSFDRETDGGLTSNHKLFFKDQNHLIIESLALENAHTGTVKLTLNPDYSYEGCLDTIPCEPTLCK